jgi:hypothetical protein
MFALDGGSTTGVGGALAVEPVVRAFERQDERRPLRIPIPTFWRYGPDQHPRMLCAP